MPKVIISGMKRVEYLMDVSEDFFPIIQKATKGEHFTTGEQEKIYNIVEDAYSHLGIECSSITTTEGDTIFDQ